MFQHVMSADTTPSAKLGEIGATPDGRLWRYNKINNAFNKYELASAIANTDVDTVSSSTDGDGNITNITEASAGWTPGQFAGAWLCVDDGTNEGQVSKIKDNTADTLKLEKDWRLTAAMAVADSDIVIHRPNLVKPVPITLLLNTLRGFAQVAFAANEYGWFLERGVGACVPGAALVLDELCTPGDDTAGEVIGVGSGETIDDISLAGRCIVPNTTADKAALIFALNI